jgi:hypothetical protein
MTVGELLDRVNAKLASADSGIDRDSQVEVCVGMFRVPAIERMSHPAFEDDNVHKFQDEAHEIYVLHGAPANDLEHPDSAILVIRGGPDLEYVPRR